MIKLTPALLLTGSIFLAGCDMELSQEAKSKAEETTQAASALKQDADASVEALKNSVSSEMEKAKETALARSQEAMTAGLSEETNKHIDNVKQKAEAFGNMKVSDLLSFGDSDEAERESEESE
ncbi:hypothetical protein MXM41_02470 [Leclercia adecarboxylata]|uniref:hypothetical protein n=1 Tax=Leclercia adecarboxylata TaxID=83655 RepID=UPI002DBC9A0B|nr:hypothetical protein [Leclercia adecarboxylata]MEB6377809.1 hypothetical protein [Leclercia adecarboxylata]